MALSKRKQGRPAPSQNGGERHPFLGGPMRVGNETLTFVLVSLLDFFMTYVLLYYSHLPGNPLHVAVLERNPIAAYFINHWGPLKGLLGFKLTLVAFVCLVTQAAAWRNERAARRVLNLGSLVTGGVVIYSLWLLVRSLG